MIALALILVQSLMVAGEPADVDRAGRKQPGFAVRGETDLPDGAIVTAWLYYGTVELGRHLDSRSVRVVGGRFEEGLTVGAPPFPGPYVVRVTVPLGRQPRAVLALLEGKEIPSAQIDVRVGTAEDEARARREYWDALGALFRRFDALAAALTDGTAPEDWRARFDEATSAFAARPENRILEPGDLAHDVFGPMAARLEALKREPERIDAVRSWAARIEARFIQRGSMTSDNAARVRKLLDAMADQADPAALLELASLLPPGAQADVQALATADDRAPILARLREWTNK